MRLRTTLFQLGVGTVILPIVLAAILGALLVKYEQDAFSEGAVARNRAFMTAVDAQLRGHIAALTLVGSSRSLDANDLQAFHEVAGRALRSQSDWQNVTLSSPSGKQLVNAHLPFGAALPGIADPVSAERVLETKSPVIGNVSMGTVTRKWGVPVRVPIIRDGAVAYVLTAVVTPESFARLIQAQHLPESWISGLVDGTRHFIARVPPRSPADLASEDFRAAIERSSEGWFRGLSVEGKDVFTAHKTSEFSHWSIGLAIPSSEVNAAANRAAWFVILGALITIALALSFAWWMGRRISLPIAQLAASARSIGRHKEPANVVADSRTQELSDVALALQEASNAIRERQRLIEREQSILRAADRAKDEFLAMLGHELRNPLSAVSNAAVILNRKESSEEGRAMALGIIVRQTGQLTHLVNDLLDVGRVVAGKIHLEQASVELCGVAHAAVSAIRVTGRAESHRIAIHCPQPVFVQGDVTRLEQVVTNLVTNAITYTPARGSIDISIATEAGWAVLSVVDTGSGLGEEDVESIFELFYQGDKALHRKGGLGIGLTLVKRLVEMHGGSVSAHSAGRGKGSTFTVRLPLIETAPTGPSMPKADQAVPSLDILVIDDNEDIRTSMKMVLEAEGHVVYLAHDGPSGLRAALSIKPRFALVDIGMPGMDGYEVASEIRKQQSDGICLIAMTGYGQPEDVQRAIHAGFDAHVVKPADFPTLLALLGKLNRRLHPERTARASQPE